MPNTYTFPTPSYEVTFRYQKKSYPKRQYFTEAIHIMCQPYNSSKAKYCALLNAESRLSCFEDVYDLVKYIRKNKKKDIIDLNEQGYLSILVKGKDIDTEVQTIDIHKISHIIVENQNSKMLDNFQEQFWASKYKEMANDKAQRKKPKEKNQDIHNQAVYFTIGDLAQNQINKDSHTFQHKAARQAILDQGIKIKVSLMYAQKLVLGISCNEKNKTDPVSFWCSFHLNNDDDELSIKDYDQLKIYVQENCIVIMNTSNKNGRKYTSSKFDNFEGNQCTVFVSLITPEI